jgi:hypothetical protein
VKGTQASVVITALASAGSWNSVAFQAPAKGTVVGLVLSYRSVSVGTAGDCALTVGVYAKAIAGTSIGPGLGIAPDAPVACWGMIQDSNKQTATFQESLRGAVYIPVEIRMQAGQQIFLCCFSDAAGGVIGSAVIQFQQN